MTDCGDAPGISHGEVTLGSSTFGSTATYSCDSGYELKGSSTRTCGSNGQWSNEAPTCECKQNLISWC